MKTWHRFWAWVDASELRKITWGETKTTFWAIAVVILIGAVGGWWVWVRQRYAPLDRFVDADLAKGYHINMKTITWVGAQPPTVTWSDTVIRLPASDIYHYSERLSCFSKHEQWLTHGDTTVQRSWIVGIEYRKFNGIWRRMP